jgi:HSP20 family molecular chaperone IbpA
MTTLLPRREDFFFPLQKEFDKLFDELFGPKRLPSLLNGVKSRSGYPKLDILVTDGKYRVEVAVPGVEPDDLKIEILVESDSCLGIETHQRVLRISGRMSHDYQYSNNIDYLFRELTRAKFQRIVRLPDEAKGEPEAVIKNGMLTLTWTLEKPLEAEVKLIPIKKE